jgi:hypothetical protein
MTDINVVPTDNNAALIELIKGQSAAATELRIQNARLFGGDGQSGAMTILFEQHRVLQHKMEGDKMELMDRIDVAKTELSTKIDTHKKTADEIVSVLRKDHTDLDKKVTGWSYVITAFQFLIMAGLAGVGIKMKAGH